MNLMKEWLNFFEKVGRLHQQMLVLPVWSRYPNHAENIWDSLAIFLEGYAFERQSRSPNYPHAAVDALLYCKGEHKGNLNGEVVNCVWKKFVELLDHKNLNPLRNPLYPAQNRQDKRSVIKVVLMKNIIPQTFTTYFRELIRNNQIRIAYNLLKSIRGVGDKIASLYMRDLKDVLEIKLNNLQERYLLQPIDTWVERTVNVLDRVDKKQAGKWINETSIKYNINPERVNMGMWFFGSRVAQSQYKLSKKLKNLKASQALLDEYMECIKNSSVLFN